MNISCKNTYKMAASSTVIPSIQWRSASLPAFKQSTISSIDLVTAKSWYYRTHTITHSFKPNIKKPIASLTNIMTALCIDELCDLFGIQPKQTHFRATEWSCNTPGTTADLPPHAWISIEDLLYGLLLPSGNDAATLLAQNFGALLFFNKNQGNIHFKGTTDVKLEITSLDLSEDQANSEMYKKQFVTYMNRRAKQLQLVQTNFATADGTDHLHSYSTCEDLYIMCSQSMKRCRIRKIVYTMTYRPVFKFQKQGRIVKKTVIWTNTNKLLEKNIVKGVKAGISRQAGGCLAVCFSIDRISQGFLVVLGSSSAERRFHDAIDIIKWASSQLRLL